MDRRLKTNILTILIGAAALLVVLHWNELLGIIGQFFGMILPVIAGVIIAFVLNVPIRGFERLLLRLEGGGKHHMKEKTRRCVSLVLTLLALVLILVLVINILVPNLADTVRNLAALVKANLPRALDMLEEYNIDTKWISDYIKDLDVNTVLSGITSSSGSIAGVLSATVGKLVSGVLGFIVALYIAIDQKRFIGQVHRIAQAYLPEKAVRRLEEVAHLIDDTYSKFLTGQCIEAVIIGVMMFAGLSLFRIPYASVIALLSAILSFIPYIGPFIACFAGALFILLIDPWQALLEIIVFEVIQFIEGQFVYPRVVGSSVGLPPLFTLLAALLGGSFFGMLGMLFFIPLTAVVYNLLRESVNRRNGEKELRRAAAAGAGTEKKKE